MNKDEYVDLLANKPWAEMQKHFDSLDPVTVKSITQLSINPQQWIDFTIENFHNAKQEWEMPKDHYPAHAKQWANINNLLGRNEHNTFELNYGILGDTNEQLKDLLGKENIAKLNVDPASILIRLLVKFPGHGVAWHQDDAGSYAKKFPHINLDPVTKTNEQGQLKRLWWSVNEWSDGHAFQISKTVLTHWKAGQVYHIPWGHGHASSNFGYCPQFTVSFTGLIFN
tara:strand:+ start:260 stop:937 length:678 start_codon:yes stop_codon:yes gene_type:complete